MVVVGLIIFSYFLGSIPFGLLFTKIVGGKDIRTIGSGNIGATNVLRTGNKKLAFITLFLDGFKGFFPLLCAYQLGVQSELSLVMIAFFSVLGHVFPIWLYFSGGKGIATGIGTYLGLSWLLGFGVVLIWFLAIKLFRMSSLGALISFSVAPILAWYFCSPLLFMYTLVMLFFIIWTHRSNIKRLLKGQEL